MNPEVNTRFTEQTEDTCRSNELGHMKVTRGQKYDHLGIILDSSLEDKLKVNIAYYAENIVAEFPEELNSRRKVP